MVFFFYLSVVLSLVIAAGVIRMGFLSFCSQQPSDYFGLAPDFSLEEQFSGRRICEGVIFGPMGRVLSRFRADMTCEWTEDVAEIEMHFRFDSGATQRRVWRMKLGQGGTFEATADDVQGTGSGSAVGPTCRLKYRIRLPADAGGHLLSVTDWMYLLESGKIVNRSQFRKFGVCVAELVATIRQEETAERRVTRRDRDAEMVEERAA